MSFKELPSMYKDIYTAGNRAEVDLILQARELALREFEQDDSWKALITTIRQEDARFVAKLNLSIPDSKVLLRIPVPFTRRPRRETVIYRK